ncbi:SRPBCC family protein [Ferruginibacter albus]|uniref:hypothetical protein n=1 Tax=Ferruginibacter albus TaxID=2875540 RepID=UPI001CC63E29|nr:hypothetical protein [Ferruginibacter albus]UAY51439.1 hypothetical protein K9M53_12675 [Ferruginibacter albus]
MRFIKPFLIGLTGLTIVITLMSLLLPSQIKISRAVVINSSAYKIYPQVADLRNWKNWQPLFADSGSAITYSDSLNKNPFCDINSEGRQLHIQMLSNMPSAIQFLLQSKNEKDIFNEISITPINTNQTQVEWKTLVKLSWFPWDKFRGIFIDRIIGPGYEESLNNLKKITETN